MPLHVLRFFDHFCARLREKIPKNFTPKTPGNPHLSPARCKNLTTKAQHRASLTEGAVAL
jgi:hypothetical protein